jgi:benzodiazapine receptor
MAPLERKQERMTRHTDPTSKASRIPPAWIYAVINALALAGVLLINWMANALPLGGLTTGEISFLYQNLFVPAGWAFSIWGVIYILLLLWVILSFAYLNRMDAYISIRVASPLFWLSCLANAGWILAWHSLMPGVSVLCMVVLLASLIILTEHLTLYRKDAPLWSYLPFELYLGWICVALIANIAAWMVSAGWIGSIFSQTVWSSVMIAVGTGLGLFYILRKQSVAFGLVIVWAIVAIYFRRHIDTSVDDALIELTALISAGILILALTARATGLLKRTTTQ